MTSSSINVSIGSCVFFSSCFSLASIGVAFCPLILFLPLRPVLSLLGVRFDYPFLDPDVGFSLSCDFSALVYFFVAASGDALILDLPEPMAFALALIGPASCPPAPITLISSSKSSELKEFLLGYIFILSFPKYKL